MRTLLYHCHDCGELCSWRHSTDECTTVRQNKEVVCLEELLGDAPLVVQNEMDKLKRIYCRFVSHITRTDFVGQYIKVRLKEEVLEMAVVKPLSTPTGTKFRCFEVSTNLVYRLDLFDLSAKGCIFVCNKKLVS